MSTLPTFSHQPQSLNSFVFSAFVHQNVVLSHSSCASSLLHLFRVTMIPARLKLASRHVSSGCAAQLRTATSLRKPAVHLPASYGSRRHSAAVKTSQAGPSSLVVEGNKPSSPTRLEKIIRDTIMVRIDIFRRVHCFQLIFLENRQQVQCPYRRTCSSVFRIQPMVTT